MADGHGGATLWLCGSSEARVSVQWSYGDGTSLSPHHSAYRTRLLWERMLLVGMLVSSMETIPGTHSFFCPLSRIPHAPGKPSPQPSTRPPIPPTPSL